MRSVAKWRSLSSISTSTQLDGWVGVKYLDFIVHFDIIHNAARYNNVIHLRSLDSNKQAGPLCKRLDAKKQPGFLSLFQWGQGFVKATHQTLNSTNSWNGDVFTGRGTHRSCFFFFQSSCLYNFSVVVVVVVDFLFWQTEATAMNATGGVDSTPDCTFACAHFHMRSSCVADVCRKG